MTDDCLPLLVLRSVAVYCVTAAAAAGAVPTGVLPDELHERIHDAEPAPSLYAGATHTRSHVS